MSRYLPTTYSKNQLENLHLNGICHLHDSWCNCGEPLTHTASIIFLKAGPNQFSNKEKEAIRKCLGDTTKETGEDDLGGVTKEDLEKLFEEDGDEKDTATG